MEANNHFFILQQLEMRYDTKILDLLSNNRKIVTDAFPPGTNVDELIREYLTSQERTNELMGSGMLLSPQESPLVLHNRKIVKRKFFGDGMHRVTDRPGHRNNGMVLFLVIALLRNASLERIPRGLGRAWRNIASRYATGSVVQRQAGYSMVFTQNCLALANITRCVQYGDWTFENFCEMLGYNIGIGEDMQKRLAVLDDDGGGLSAPQMSAVVKSAAADSLIVAAERADASMAKTLASKAKSDVFVKTKELSHQIMKFEAAFNGSPWGILVRCICNDPDMQNGSFTSSFFSEILLARVMLCYLYSIFFIIETSIPELANLWKKLPSCKHVEHVVEVFQRNVFGPCRKELVEYIKECIRKAFAEDACLSLQTYLVGKINKNTKGPLLRAVGKGLFDDSDILCKRGRSPIVDSSSAIYHGDYDDHGYIFYGIENEEEDVNLSDIPNDIEHVDRGIEHYQQLISRARSGAAGAAEDSAHHKRQLKRYKQKREQLLEQIESQKAMDKSMREGGGNLIHKKKRSSKSNKRSKFNKRSKTNKHSKSNKQSKSMKRK